MNKNLKKSLYISTTAFTLGLGFTGVAQSINPQTALASKKSKVRVIKTKKVAKYRVSYKSNGPVYSTSKLSKKLTTIAKIKKDKLYVTKEAKVKKLGKHYLYLYLKDSSHSNNSGWVHNSHVKKTTNKKTTWKTVNIGSNQKDPLKAEKEEEKAAKGYSYQEGVDLAKQKLISFVNSERSKAGVDQWIHDDGAQQVADIRAQQASQNDSQSHYMDPSTGSYHYYPQSSSMIPMFNLVEKDLGFISSYWDNSNLKQSNEAIAELGHLKDAYGKITEQSIDDDLEGGAYGMITDDGASNYGHKDLLLSATQKYYAIGMASRKDQYNHNKTYIIVISSDKPLTKTTSSSSSSSSSDGVNKTTVNQNGETITSDGMKVIPRSQDDKNYQGSSAQKYDQSNQNNQ